ncbi:MAG: hypothetical protein ACFFG0_01450 [Candidatus Thorarchaeota archaeon]
MTEGTVTSIELDAEEYNDFLRCLINLREVCNDVDIRGGMIRQRSNDLTAVFELDMKPVLNEINLPISNLKKKLDLLKAFSGQEVKIEINEGENESTSYFVISDSQSSIRFLFPTLEFLDNKFMTEEELDNIFNLEEEDLLMHSDLSSVVTDRINVITTNFNTQAIRINFEGDEASITASTASKDQVAKFKEGILTNINFSGRYFSNLSTIPFSIEHDEDLVFKMYKDPNQNVSLNNIKTQLGSVEISIFSRSTLIEDEND